MVYIPLCHWLWSGGILADGSPNAVVGNGALDFAGRELLLAQIGATLITWGLALVASFVILKVVDTLVGLHGSAEEEIEGLDLSQHGEEGYILI